MNYEEWEKSTRPSLWPVYIAAACAATGVAFGVVNEDYISAAWSGAGAIMSLLCVWFVKHRNRP